MSLDQTVPIYESLLESFLQYLVPFFILSLLTVIIIIKKFRSLKSKDHTCDIILDANREIWALKSYFVF